MKTDNNNCKSNFSNAHDQITFKEITQKKKQQIEYIRINPNLKKKLSLQKNCVRDQWY